MSYPSHPHLTPPSDIEFSGERSESAAKEEFKNP